MSQLSLPFIAKDFSEEDFLLLAENSAAKKLLDNFFSQKDFLNARLPSLILKGSKSCGKTHLLHIFSKKFSAEFLDHQKISQINLVDFFTQNHFYILDDLDEIKDEELLLRLINSAFEAKAFLILGARDISQFRLKDLVSRLKNIVIADIKNLQIDSVKQLVVNGFARRQIKLSAQLIDFISSNVERDYDAILRVINAVEIFAAENGKNISLKDVKSFLESC